MPYKDPAQQRDYQLKWKAKRRADWFSENGPCADCKTWDNLQLDHVDPTIKIDHKVWSWSKARRDAELAKCVARCESCHIKKSATEKVCGEQHYRSHLTENDVQEIRRLAYLPRDEIAQMFGVQKAAVSKIITRRNWKHLQ